MKLRLTKEHKEALRESPPILVGALLYVLAFPNAGLWPLGFLCLVPAISLTVGASTGKRAFWFGWLAGFAGNVGKLYWLVYTINHYGHFPLPAAVLIHFLFCAVIGTIWGAGFYGAHYLIRGGRYPLWLAFPLSWMFQEWLFTWLLTGFPWELLGHCLVGWLPLAQSADLVGGIGLSLPLAFGNVVAYEAWSYLRHRRKSFPWAHVVILATVLAAMTIYGFVRMKEIDGIMEKGATIRIGMLQGNVDQNRKWDPRFKKKTLATYRLQAKKTVSEGAQLILMPETALPYWQNQNRRLRGSLRRFVDAVDAWVLLAVPTRVDNDKDPEWPYKYNSVVLVTPEGEKTVWYNKHRLVPFGEYLPLKKLAVPLVKWLRSFEPLSRLRLSAGFYVGEEYTVFPYPDAHFGLAICYEIIYPGIVRKIAKMGTGFMVTITNDAWFGDTSAPHQHWDQVAMRAIELRRYFARSANTGISGIIDANGRTVLATDTYVAAALTGDIKVMKIESLYMRFGDWVLYGCVVIFAGLVIITRFRKGMGSKL